MDFFKKLIFFSACIFFNKAFGIEKLFYAVPDKNASQYAIHDIDDFKQHYKKIDIIAPQIYQIDRDGLVWGDIDLEFFRFAKSHRIKILPLVSNKNFDQVNVHVFLHDLIAQDRAILFLLAACEKYHYEGLQLDFENISATDRNALTRFYRKLATTLHKNGFIASIAIVPRLSEVPGNSDRDRWVYENWSGVYDLQALGAASDFVTLMTYDQHGMLTTPGPVAGYPWIDAALQYSLRYIPGNKISLGIPAYSGHWYTGKISWSKKYPIESKSRAISYARVNALLKQFKFSFNWDQLQKVSHTVFIRNNLNEYLFVENAQSFAAKLDLVNKYHLRGFSVWRLGLEDPKIWQLL